MIWNSKKIKKEDKMIKHYLTVFLISMVPIAELRAAIPYSQAVGLPLIPSYVIAIIGNMLPVPAQQKAKKAEKSYRQLQEEDSLLHYFYL